MFLNQSRNFSGANDRQINVYVDPTSPAHLDNQLFKEFPEDREDDFHRIWRHLREYCLQRGIALNTVDFYDPKKAREDDIYLSLEHKGFIRKFYWRKRKNKLYPLLNLKNFKKKILLQGEPPMADPAAYQNIEGLFKVYDKIYFPFKFSDPRISFWQIPFSRDNIPDYWANKDRKFLTMINSNNSPRSPRQAALLILSGKGLRYLGYKELLTERLRAIEFFSRTGEIDLYGYGWDRPPFFPYWSYAASIRKVYKGSVSFKLRTLSEYNFAITYENCSLPGHISEKIFDCFYAGTVPVYLGATDIEEYIPKNCFIDMRDFSVKGGYDYEKLRRFLKSLSDADIEKYRGNAREFLQSEKMKPFTKEYFAEFFVNQILA